jgi:hypothetical protein
MNIVTFHQYEKKYRKNTEEPKNIAVRVSLHVPSSHRFTASSMADRDVTPSCCQQR